MKRGDKRLNSSYFVGKNIKFVQVLQIIFLKVTFDYEMSGLWSVVGEVSSIYKTSEVKEGEVEFGEVLLQYIFRGEFGSNDENIWQALAL